MLYLKETSMTSKKLKQNIHGWLNFNKPSGISSARALSRVKRLFNAKKAGHAGTLDPLAEGILPIAFGKKTKEVNRLMEAPKTYIFTITFGTQTDSDDANGSVIHTSEVRPVLHDLKALLPHFTGMITQLPPQISAIKIGGERAYKRVRRGERVPLPPRQVNVASFKLMSTEPTSPSKNKPEPHLQTATLCATVSKGTYIRSIARDIGSKLGCLGHVSYLQRTKVGSFSIESAFTLEELEHTTNNNNNIIKLLSSNVE